MFCEVTWREVKVNFTDKFHITVNLTEVILLKLNIMYYLYKYSVSLIP